MKNQKINRTNTSVHGFTLVELMVAVAIIGILAAIAYPSYQDHLIKSKRKEAQADLLRLQLSLEKWRANNNNYSATLTQLAFTDDNANYNFSISPDTTSPGSLYTITAAAQGAQATADSTCRNLTINQSSSKGPSGCWLGVGS